MSKPLDLIPSHLQTRVQGAALRRVLTLPRPVLRRIAGEPIRIDGQELALEAQALLRLQALAGRTQLSADTAEKARAGMREAAEIIGNAPVAEVEARSERIPTASGGLDARLYRPETLTEPSELMVFYHGGGWVIGDLDSHDGLCRMLAEHIGIRVLSVDYRLAPEHPFPAAVDDAIDGYRYALDHAEELGSTPDSLLVGGDSAGGNLAAAVAQHATASGTKKPVLQALLYPAVDASVRRRSRELFGEGFLLTDTDMDWFMDHYQPDPDLRGDPRLSVLLAEDLSDLPPAYVVTAGFDPLRDEGEEYVRRLRQAGVPVAARRFPDLMHGFLNLYAAGGRFQEVLFEIIGSIRASLALRS
ncbi:acetyl esterase [Halopolyspora algeriensis]|uniref:Acetyl esterase n=1 Tax=Halopolyspora algeriensis TaxID=1500506 RepID=A0A368VGG2_9ACTN|nr:alpha/beta hydrolase [Halopolyspora algeriensis]RCW40257.1 acetyl esterase [Halopolyspora algeriensis]TQM46262.1 acetyl esterase [Halopolyspora algeriensis]